LLDELDGKSVEAMDASLADVMAKLMPADSDDPRNAPSHTPTEPTA